MPHVEGYISSLSRQLGGDGDGGGGGVHIAYEDLYSSIMFFATVYVGGQIAARLLKMPSLVGEIFVGILLGPSLADYVPYPISFVMLGEIGLVLLVIEAGMDIDLTTLELIGSRGMLIAIVGSILPIALAFLVALGLNPNDIQSAVAAGCCFGPTSLGIAMNILRQGKIVNTPVGQLIVSAAVIDDMIALIILSQLGALAGGANVTSIVVPIVSALAFLVLGGYIAVFILPRLLDKYFFACVKNDNQGTAGLAFMFLLLFAMMPATYYSKSSFLMGAFLSGLVFCRNPDVHTCFVSQFKRLLQWLMRIFFAASIGFQVPIKDFGDFKVIGDGLLFTLALTGKLFVGLMVPNFNNCDKFKGLHLRDCLITGCSMAAEGEFAFVIAVFAVDNGLISADLYASIVLAVLLSTIVPPFLLRYTISYFDRVAENLVTRAEELECTRRRSLLEDDSLNLSLEEEEKRLRERIEANNIIFLHVEIQCLSAWGLIPKIISTLASLKLEVIDNRSWHPKGVGNTQSFLMTEIFLQDDFFLDGDKEMSKTIEERIVEVNQTIDERIRQPGAKVKVTRWFPGVLQAVLEEDESSSSVKLESSRSVKDLLAMEATATLESKRNLQESVTIAESPGKTKEKREVNEAESVAHKLGPSGDQPLPQAAPVAPGRRLRQKMKSAPFIGASLFNDPETTKRDEPKVSCDDGSIPMPLPSSGRAGQSAELVIGEEVFKIRVMPETIHRIRSGYSGELFDDSSLKFSSADVPVEHHLKGFVRTKTELCLSTISEDVSKTAP